MFLLLPILPAFLGTFNYLQNIEILESEWYSLWTQHTLFMCYFFLPAMIAVYASYLFHLEHQQHNWNALLSSPMPRVNFYLAKLLVCVALVVITQLWIAILFVISGLLIGLPFPLPFEFVWWIFIRHHWRHCHCSHSIMYIHGHSQLCRSGGDRFLWAAFWVSW